MTTSPAADQRIELLRSLGADPQEVEELQRYNRSQFRLDALSSPITLPLADEPFLAAWDEYAAQARQSSVFEVLRNHLIQLQFPIQAGISASSEYAAATRKGQLSHGVRAEGLRLSAPERLELVLHPTAVGRVPVLIAGDRADFVALVQALARRNEPAPIPDSLGAMMISGYNNWNRVARLKQRFELGELAIPAATDWNKAFAQIREHKELYQDRLLLLATGPYSGVAAAELGLPAQLWERLSLLIRLEHECAHYLTRRLLHSMRNNLLDELIADYAGIAAAAGEFVGGWLLRFMGLENPDHFRTSGRLSNYRGDPPLSDGAFRTLQQLARRACRNLEAADRTLSPKNRSRAGRCRMILALARLSLEELAGQDATQRIAAHFNAMRVTWARLDADQIGPVSPKTWLVEAS